MHLPQVRKSTGLKRLEAYGFNIDPYFGRNSREIVAELGRVVCNERVQSTSWLRVCRVRACRGKYGQSTHISADRYAGFVTLTTEAAGQSKTNSTKWSCSLVPTILGVRRASMALLTSAEQFEVVASWVLAVMQSGDRIELAGTAIAWAPAKTVVRPPANMNGATFETGVCSMPITA